MAANVMCKDCKTIIKNLNPLSATLCECGKCAVIKTARGFAASSGANYCLVDDKGHEIVCKDVPSAKQEVIDVVPDEGLALGDKEVWDELMLVLSHQIESMENWSQGGRFSPATNQDMLAHFVWLHAALKWKQKQMLTLAATSEDHETRLQDLEGVPRSKLKAPSSGRKRKSL